MAHQKWPPRQLDAAVVVVATPRPGGTLPGRDEEPRDLFPRKPGLRPRRDPLQEPLDQIGVDAEAMHRLGPRGAGPKQTAAVQGSLRGGAESGKVGEQRGMPMLGPPRRCGAEPLGGCAILPQALRQELREDGIVEALLRG